MCVYGVCVCNRGRGSLFATQLYADCKSRPASLKNTVPFQKNPPSRSPKKEGFYRQEEKMCHPSLPLSSSIVHFQKPPSVFTLVKALRGELLFAE